ncbi:hypothetical protein JHK87_001393 [Glycine soja]|nr:hypothetical protein JHK87_001393 [Glycine soja]
MQKGRRKYLKVSVLWWRKRNVNPKGEEVALTTAMLKVMALCPCTGCNNRIHRPVLKNKGREGNGDGEGHDGRGSFGKEVVREVKRKIESNNSDAEGDDALPMQGLQQ